jgi:hypothetical protein
MHHSHFFLTIQTTSPLTASVPEIQKAILQTRIGIQGNQLPITLLKNSLWHKRRYGNPWERE